MSWGGAITALYGYFAVVSSLNWALMERPSPESDGPSFCVLIPARDEAANLRELLPLLGAHAAGAQVVVFDDESSDATAEVARSLGATVIPAAEPLPAGWTGKNRACH